MNTVAQGDSRATPGPVADASKKRRLLGGIVSLLRERPSPGPTVPLAVALGVNTFVAFTGWTVAGAPAWVVGGALILGLALADLGLSPRPRSLGIQREADEVLAIGETHKVLLTLVNHSDSPLSLRLKDEPPLGFERSHKELSVTVPARSTEVVQYTVTPTERGECTFCGCTYRYRTRWNLWSWQGRVRLDASVRVYPNLAALRRHQLLIEHQWRKEPGIRRPAWHGKGTDFDRVREYGPDDEPRQINWLAAARRGRLMVNEYKTPRNQTVMLLFDAGRLGAARIGRHEQRLDHALNAGLLLAQTALDHDDYVGALVFADEVLAFLPPGRGSQQMRLLLRLLFAVRPRTVEADYAHALTFLKTRVRKRSLVCMFTDLAESESADLLAQQLIHLSPQHLPLCVAISDPAVFDLAQEKPRSVQGVYEKAVARQTLMARQRVATRLRHRGVYLADAPPRHIHMEALNAFLDLKARARL